MTHANSLPRLELDIRNRGVEGSGLMICAIANGRRLAILSGLSLAIVAVLATAWSRVEAALPDVTVGSASADEGQTTTVAITLSEATVGLAGFDVIVALSDPTVANIVRADFPNFGLEKQVLTSAAEIRLTAVDLSGLIQSGATSTLLATVHVVGVKAGASNVNLQVVRMDDENGFPMNPQTLPGTVNILNVAPVVDAGSDVTIAKRDTFAGSGSFVDPGNDVWTATVDYGDGSGVQPLTVSGNTFALSHVFADAGIYTVTVEVTDGSGAIGPDALQVQVTFPTLPGMSAPAQDLDGDARAEDINGNGELDFADLLTLFTHMNSPEVQNNAVDFDYNSNGLVDMADIIALFDMMIAMFPPS